MTEPSFAPAESLKKELAYYINRPEEAAAIGAIAKERAEREYSWDAIARQTLEAYEEVLHQHSSAKEPYAPYRTK